MERKSGLKKETEDKSSMEDGRSVLSRPWKELLGREFDFQSAYVNEDEIRFCLFLKMLNKGSFFMYSM